MIHLYAEYIRLEEKEKKNKEIYRESDLNPFY
jgi:hypothetical protein